MEEKKDKIIRRDFTKEEKKDEECEGKKKLRRINEMMKLESIHFAGRLEKQFRIMSDLCGLNLNNIQQGLKLIPSKGEKFVCMDISLDKQFAAQQSIEKFEIKLIDGKDSPRKFNNTCNK